MAATTRPNSIIDRATRNAIDTLIIDNNTVELPHTFDLPLPHVFTMPSAHSQKGTGKKGRDIRQSRSRNTTPSLAGSVVPPSESGETSYLGLPIQSFRTFDDIVEPYVSPIPTSKELETLVERLQRLADVVETRGGVCDRGMRMLAQGRKDRLEEIESQRRAEEQNERLKKEAADEEERGRHKANKIKKKKDASSGKEDRPLTHGAHGLAPQDGSQLSMFDLLNDLLFTSYLETLTISYQKQLHQHKSPARTCVHCQEIWIQPVHLCPQLPRPHLSQAWILMRRT